ncbi:MAG: hypothetical protein HY902_09815 [Deltaproteobacteria bacterium]|nr:hypothetical protein [Deltaproteobacteria bacterium]
MRRRDDPEVADWLAPAGLGHVQAWREFRQRFNAFPHSETAGHKTPPYAGKESQLDAWLAALCGQAEEVAAPQLLP